jgi:hypothetical protein
LEAFALYTKITNYKLINNFGVGGLQNGKNQPKKSASDAGAEGAFVYVVAHRRKREAKRMI